MENEFKFINQKEIYQYKFYMIPKELFVNERYTSLSPTAILLYGILLDRLTLSIKNNWIDKNGNGLLRLNYLKEHKKADYIIMFMNKTLNKHLKEVQETAKARVDVLTKEFAKQDNVNEELKARNQLE